ncbi:MAG: dienelactone hydrolase, partial [Cellvibrionaceae bacterium]
PIVAPIVAVTDGYPEPEVIVPVDGSGYPEPDQESAESVTESLPLSQEVVISAPDELGLIGTFNSNQPDTPQPGVLLLHMAGGSRSDWETAGFVQLLNDQGYTTLALDLRGHGDSVSAVDWALAEEDMAVVWDWFVNQPEVDGANSMIVGASIGSSLALRSAVSQPAAKAAVLLSPGLNYFDVTTDDAIAQIDRPVLMVAMTLDKYSADTVTRLSEINPAVSTAEIQTGSSHGTSMFAMYDGLDLLILDFLNANRG